MKFVEGTVAVDDVDAFVARIDEVASKTGTTIQAFDARYVVSERHLERAVELADRAIERGDNVARDRAVEILLYAAGRRQITDALELGIDSGANRIVVLVDGDDATEDECRAVETDERCATEMDDRRAVETTECQAVETDERRAVETLRSDVLDSVEPTLGDYDTDRVREYFGIDDAELDVVDGDLEAVVLERVALLVVEK